VLPFVLWAPVLADKWRHCVTSLLPPFGGDLGRSVFYGFSLTNWLILPCGPCLLPIDPALCSGTQRKAVLPFPSPHWPQLVPPFFLPFLWQTTQQTWEIPLPFKWPERPGFSFSPAPSLPAFFSFSPLWSGPGRRASRIGPSPTHIGPLYTPHQHF